jgi:hypothetical protein
VTGLRELFEELAERPPAPAPLAADELYAAGRRTRRRRRAAWGTTAALAAGAVAAGAVGVAGVIGVGAPERAAPGEHAATSPGPSTPAPVVAPPVGGDQWVDWVGAADATYLYRKAAACSRPSVLCPKTRRQLSASTDGGRTWAGRGPVIELTGLTVLDRRTLVGTDVGSSARGPVVSTDGGRTWSPVPAGAAVTSVTVAATICRPAGDGSACHIYGMDEQGRLGWLADQPAIVLTGGGLVTAAGDRLWVGGHDPRSDQPAAAFSADGGHTWSVYAFAGFPDCADAGCHRVRVTTGDGRTAYALITDGEGRREVVYRGTAGGDWRRVGDRTLPAGVMSGGNSFVTRDGAHIVSRYDYDHVAYRETGLQRFWAVPGGDDRPVPMVGLPEAVRGIGRAPDGWLYAGLFDGTVYGSTDGRHWAPTTD